MLFMFLMVISSILWKFKIRYQNSPRTLSGFEMNFLKQVLPKQKMSPPRLKQQQQHRKQSTAIGDSAKANGSTEYNFEDAKKILLYTDFYGWSRKWPHGQGHRKFVRYKCPVSNCHMTHNKSLLPSVADFDALVFNLWPANILRTEGREKK